MHILNAPAASSLNYNWVLLVDSSTETCNPTLTPAPCTQSSHSPLRTLFPQPDCKLPPYLTWLPISELKPKFPCGQYNCKYVHLSWNTCSSSASDRSVYPEKGGLHFTVDCLIEWLFYTLLRDSNKITTLSLFKQTWSKKTALTITRAKYYFVHYANTQYT